MPCSLTQAVATVLIAISLHALGSTGFDIRERHIFVSNPGPDLRWAFLFDFTAGDKRLCLLVVACNEVHSHHTTMKRP
ncbi:hypothetical protein BGZ61DRAFT_447439 [Ilyonectria robusta]|uniref:uncharacterized protein n=1 Tax=Ilyonectria robusta TaxID=1079257 RepID=UPI001E8CF1C8|nr:uncharacterized protein BGZ61DRAFT_447439 [Ilyonectria robusta]KAH8721781.1 hypothetical protein BGZ61DRAFT_447439 [Ilyonectria robusta]